MPTAIDGLRLEVRFDGVTWEDVTPWLKLEQKGSVKYGRSSVYSAAAIAQLSIVLDNQDGRFTPNRQILADGTDHPYWPNVRARVLVRLSVVVGADLYQRFQGKVSGWPATEDVDGRASVTLVAYDVQRPLSNQVLIGTIPTDLLDDDPAFYWPLGDPAGSSAGGEYSGAAPLTAIGSGGPVTFGGAAVMPDDTGALTFAPTSAVSGQILANQRLRWWAPSGMTFECWLRVPAAPAWFPAAPLTFASIADAYGGLVGNSIALSIADATGVIGVVGTAGGSTVFVTSSPTSVLDGASHHVVLTVTAAGVIHVWVDGHQVASNSGLPSWAIYVMGVTIGDSYLFYDPNSGARFVGSIAHVALYGSALSSGRIAAHYSAGQGWYGETVDERLVRLLGYGGYSGSDIDIDASSVRLGGYAHGGKTVWGACADAVGSEGGGSALFVDPSGPIRFVNRAAQPTAIDAALTVTIGEDDGATFAPSNDDTSIVNLVTATKAALAGTSAAGVASDATSIAEYGEQTDAVTSYATTRADVLNVAQERVATQRQPAWRLGTLTVDMMTAQNDLWADVVAATIGTRLRTANLPRRVAPRPAMDSFVEGWTDTFDETSYTIAFDTSPADNPAWGVWDDDTYGRWQASGITLGADIGAADTSIDAETVLTRPYFTVNTADFPFYIQIEEEVMQVTLPAPAAAHGQTLTVVRGELGTDAVPHPSGVSIRMYPASTWSL